MNMPKIYLLAGCIFLLIMLMGCSLATKPESPANESTANDNCLMEVSPSPMHKGEAVEIVFNFHLTGLYKLVITNVLEQEVISFKVTDSPVFWNEKINMDSFAKPGSII